MKTIKKATSNIFIEFCDELNRKCISLQLLPKEVISHEEAFEAYSYLKNMKLQNSGDILIYCSALNLLNTYVKQKDKKIGYGFKRELGYLVGIALNLDIEDILYDLQTEEKNSLMIVQVGSVQFSFHNIDVTKEVKTLKERYNCRRIEWDGIRKQNCASSIWRYAIKNNLRTCNLTYRGKNLNNKITKMTERYKNGEIDFCDL